MWSHRRKAAECWRIQRVSRSVLPSHESSLLWRSGHRFIVSTSSSFTSSDKRSSTWNNRPVSDTKEERCSAPRLPWSEERSPQPEKKNKKSKVPAAVKLLEEQVSRCREQKNALEAIRLLRESLGVERPHPHPVVFSWSAFCDTLYLCDVCDQAKSGVQLIKVVRGLQESAHSLPDSLRLAQYQNWTHKQNLLALTLRLQCAAGDEEAATHLIAFLMQHGRLRKRTACTYLNFCCAWPSPASVSTEQRLAKSIHFFQACQEEGVELDVPTLTAVGRFWAVHRQPYARLSCLLEVMRDKEMVADSYFVEEVLRRWSVQQHMPDALRLTVDTMVPLPLKLSSASSSCSCSEEMFCPHCGHVLHKHPFTANERDTLLRDLEQQIMYDSTRSGGEQRKQLVRRSLDCWKRLLQQSQEERLPYDLFIDGANVGYYGLSKWYGVAKVRESTTPANTNTEREQEEAWNAAFKARQRGGSGAAGIPQRGVDVQLDFALMDQALTMATTAFHFRRPMLFLHSRHCRVEQLSERNAALLQKWLRAGQVYTTMSGANDDLWWLFGALYLTRPSDYTLPATGTSTSQEGSPTRASEVFVLTNDRLPDHAFHLLNPRSLRRWKQHYSIRFHCERVEEATHLRWEWPASYSRIPQTVDPLRSHATPAEGAQRATQVWHIPLQRTRDASTPLSSTAVGRGESASLTTAEKDDAEDKVPVEGPENAMDFVRGAAQDEEWVCVQYYRKEDTHVST